MSELVKYQAPELEVGHHTEIAEAYQPFLLAMIENAKTAQAIRAKFDSLDNNADKVELGKEAYTLRNANVKQRTGLDKARKALKDDALAYSKVVDGTARVAKLFGDEIEADMKAIEDFAEHLRLNEISRLNTERKDQIEAIGGTDFLYKYTSGLGNYRPEEFDSVLQEVDMLVKAANIVKAEEARVAEQARLDKEAKDKADKAQADEAIRAKAQADAEAKAQQAIEDAEAKAQKAIEDAQNAEIARAQAFANAIEQARLAKIDADARQAKAVADARLKAIEDAKAKAKADAEAIAQGSDKVKVKAIADKVKALLIELEGMTFQSAICTEKMSVAKSEISRLDSAFLRLYNSL